MECRQSKPSELIAAFDLDHTLLKPTKGVFPKTRDDAVLVFPEIKKKFTQLRRKGYKIVIFTNQKGIPKHLSVEDLYYKINKYLPRGDEIDIYISFAADANRKPSPAMFDKFIEHNGAITDIFYVGDAAGRQGDFSASDLQFAHNCGMTFYTPEQFFLDDKDNSAGHMPILEPPKPIALHHHIMKNTVIILMGYPASGKTTFAQHIATTHCGAVIINNDITGSPGKSFTLYKKALSESAPYIIIDNTNPTIINRVQYIEPAKDKGYKVYAIRFAIGQDIAMHLNWYRAYTTSSTLIPEVAYRMYKSRLEPITDTEGFDYIDDYIPKFDSAIFEYSFIHCQQNKES